MMDPEAIVSQIPPQKIKLLLLINSNNKEFTSIEKCRTRSDFIGFMLKNHFAKMDNVDVSLKKCYPNVKVNYKSNEAIHVFPYVDHIIFIDETGFYSKNVSFVDNLRKYSKYSVTSLCKGGKFYCGEDIMFSYIKDVIGYSVYMDPPFDQYIYAPRKQNNIIYILLSKPDVISKQLNIKEINYVLTKIKSVIDGTNSKKLEFKIGLINGTSIDYINTDMNVLISKQFEMYIDYIHELSKANMYILTDMINDTYRLHECAMAGTLIVSNSNYIQNDLAQKLNIYTYTDELVWNDLFKALSTNKLRLSLIDAEYNWDKYAQEIINKLKEYEEQHPVQRALCMPETLKHIHTKCYLNIHNTKKPHMVKLCDPNKKVLVTEKKKNCVYLQ